MSKHKAFARYANNKIVPGSLILSDKAPKVGVWKEVVSDLCCTPSSNCDSCVTLLALPDEVGLYGFTLETRNNGGPNLTGTIYWDTNQQESFSLPANSNNYDFEYEYNDGLVHQVRLCVDNPSQIQDFELGFGPGITIGLTNASALNGIDEWDSDDMNIYALDLTGLSSMADLYHCCSLLRHINITGCTNLTDVDLFDNSLTTESVDHVLITLDDNGLSNGYVNLIGSNNGVPTALGLAAKTSLEGKGWTVNVNP